jgi:hypothetical protein
MATGSKETTIARDPDTVWKIVSDFGGLAGWAPGIESCELDGDVRTITTMGTTVKEQLVSRDDAARALTYSIVESPLGLGVHRNTFTVYAAGDGSRVTSEYEIAPDEMCDLFGQIYGQFLDALKSTAEA